MVNHPSLNAYREITIRKIGVQWMLNTFWQSNQHPTNNSPFNVQKRS
jgi:hypothetical protein